MARRNKITMRKEVDLITRDVKSMKEKLVERTPSHFSKKDIVNALFGTLIICISFVMSGNFIKIALGLSILQTALIAIATITILSIEIYFIAYLRVKDKRKRPFLQFYLKRLFALYFTGLLVSFSIIIIFGVSSYALNWLYTAKMVVLLALPSSIGGAIPSLLRQY